MKEYAKKHPVIFEIVLFLAGLALALIGAMPGIVISLDNDFCLAVGRIIAGVIILLIFGEALHGGNALKGLNIALPGLLFGIWNIVYNLTSGMTLHPVSMWIMPLILALAPAVFEEVVFRCVFVHNLRENGQNDKYIFWITAIVFGAIHMTNAVGADLLNTMIQVGYATVIGMLLGAVYIKSHDLVSVVLLHCFIDFCSKIFVSSPEQTSPVMLAAFVALLVLESAYAIWLMYRK